MLFMLLFSGGLLGDVATAQSCWRDTACTGPIQTAFPGPWEENIFAPASRTVYPVDLSPLGDESPVSDYPARVSLSSNASAYVYDFGKEVGGIVTVQYSVTGAGALGLAFTEAKNGIGLASDSSDGFSARVNDEQPDNDGAIYSHFTSAGNYTYEMDLQDLRGGFRYLTLFLLKDDGSTTILNIDAVSLEIGFQPAWPNLKAYQGYFHSNDAQLNKIWYSGAYTLQTNYVPVNTGRQVPLVADGWANNGTVANGSTVIVAGANRYRAIWPGDMEIAVPSSFVSLGDDLDGVKNALQSIYDHQNEDGSLLGAGLPLMEESSDTYHMWAMIGTYNYVLYTNDTAFLTPNWEKYVHAMEYICSKILQPLGLLNVTGTRDWARVATDGYGSEPNMILYHTLTTGSELAEWMGNTALNETYALRAKDLASNIMEHMLDRSHGAFRDNNTDIPLYPQDANSMALLFGVVAADSSLARSISERLTDNWTPIGAERPEMPGNISPFISSFEIKGHLAAGETARALDLTKRCWGWYLNNVNGTQSTVVEGYLTDGSFGHRNYRDYPFDESYVSHSHGWSSGPTSALTEYVLGLKITGRLGTTWQLAPQFGNLKKVEGGFTTSLGQFQAQWNVSFCGKSYHLEWSVPQGTKGTVVVPGLPSGETGVVTHNGRRVGTVTKHRRLSLHNLLGGSQKVSVSRLFYR